MRSGNIYLKKKNKLLNQGKDRVYSNGSHSLLPFPAHSSTWWKLYSVWIWPRKWYSFFLSFWHYLTMREKPAASAIPLALSYVAKFLVRAASQEANASFLYQQGWGSIPSKQVENTGPCRPSACLAHGIKVLHQERKDEKTRGYHLSPAPCLQIMASLQEMAIVPSHIPERGPRDSAQTERKSVRTGIQNSCGRD